MIRNNILGIVFLFTGVLLFSSYIGGDLNIFSNSTYFLSSPSQHINSKRDFSFGQSFEISEQIVSKSKLPIINLQVDVNDLFGFNKGIYTLGSEYFNCQSTKSKPWWRQQANYHIKGGLSEREASVNFYSLKSEVEHFNSKIKINGNNTRAYSQKSFRIKDKGVIQQDIFSEKTSNWLILRNSGNDWDRTMFADAFMSSTLAGLNVFSSESKLTSVYINNSFWGIYNARQRIDEDFIASKLLIDKSKILLFENNGVVKSGGRKADKELKKLVKIINEKNVDLLMKSINVDNFIDYFFIETFFNNTDWPNNNVLFYKADSKNEKWNFIPKDLDYGMSYTSDSAHLNNTFKYALKKKNTLLVKLFSVLISNEEFKSQFVSRIEVVMLNDFSKEKLLNRFLVYEEGYKPHILLQINRWRYPRTKIKWQKYVNSNYIFLKHRSDNYLSHLHSL